MIRYPTLYIVVSIQLSSEFRGAQLFVSSHSSHARKRDQILPWRNSKKSSSGVAIQMLRSYEGGQQLDVCFVG